VTYPLWALSPITQLSLTESKLTNFLTIRLPYCSHALAHFQGQYDVVLAIVLASDCITASASDTLKVWNSVDSRQHHLAASKTLRNLKLYLPLTDQYH